MNINEQSTKMKNEIFFEIRTENLNLRRSYRYRLKMSLLKTNQNQDSNLEQNLKNIVIHFIAYLI